MTPVPQHTLIAVALQYAVELYDLKLALLIAEEVGRYEPDKKQQILAETLETLVGLTPHDSRWVYGG